jgi:hypothetical protein
MAFPEEGRTLEALGVSASNVAAAFLRFYGEWFLRPNYLVENLKIVPWPSCAADLLQRIEGLVHEEVARRRRVYQNHEPFHEFVAPDLLFRYTNRTTLSFDLRSLLGNQLDVAIAHAYGLVGDEFTVLQRDMFEAIQARRTTPSESADGDTDEAEDSSDFVLATDERSEMEALVSYAVGCAFGRWDVRIGGNSALAPKLLGPFDPLTICPPGMLLGPDGLPATPGRIVSEEWLLARPNANVLPLEGSVQNLTIKDEEYRLKNIPWDGVLVDDEGHPADIVTRVREVFHALWQDRADEVERQACEVLEVKALRAYFRNARSFFAEHIKRFTKSRRKAPIYWLLQTSKKSYGLWLYYHRLTGDTLFHALRTYVEPKIQHEEARRHELRRLYEAAKAAKAGNEERRLAKEMEAQENILGELTEFKTRIEAVAYGRVPGAEPGCPGWAPNLNDGVILNIAPLYAIVPWKDAAATWDELVGGQYDWSHVAMSFWPQRVAVKCKDDRSIAIAHGQRRD